MMLHHIVNRGLEKGGVILEVPYSPVARVTQKTAQVAGRVTMVEAKALALPRNSVAANGASPILLIKKTLVDNFVRWSVISHWTAQTASEIGQKYAVRACSLPTVKFGVAFAKIIGRAENFAFVAIFRSVRSLEAAWSFLAVFFDAKPLAHFACPAESVFRLRVRIKFVHGFCLPAKFAEFFQDASPDLFHRETALFCAPFARS